MALVDLRSDTITRPTPGMRRAIAEAEVGDDVFGDDPTVNRLQERMSKLLDKPAAIFVPSGTMANQIALRVQTRPGDQIVCESDAHVYFYEQGGPAALSGLLVACVPGVDGALSWDRVAPVLNPDDQHFAPPSLICLENTHNRAGGRILPQDGVVDLADRAHAAGLRVHLDGARLWNAHVATGLSLAELSGPFDTVSLCFSKGMGAPVGSVLAGSIDDIAAAHRVRKLFGGGMRQAGILAAACLYALDHNLARLADDHRRARRIATGLDNPLLALDHEVQTNIVVLRTAAPQAVLAHLESDGVLGIGFGTDRVRIVTNLSVDDAGIERTVASLNAYREE